MRDVALSRAARTQRPRRGSAGLAAAHALGVIHRDLKPANVMIDGRGNGRITDFGLAVIGGNSHSGRALEGTPAYMAPEQLAGAAVTELTDIYAFGLTVYELLTGKRFFQAPSIEALRAEHRARPHSFRETRRKAAALADQTPCTINAAG